MAIFKQQTPDMSRRPTIHAGHLRWIWQLLYSHRRGQISAQLFLCVFVPRRGTKTGKWVWLSHRLSLYNEYSPSLRVRLPMNVHPLLEFSWWVTSHPLSWGPLGNLANKLNVDLNCSRTETVFCMRLRLLQSKNRVLITPRLNHCYSFFPDRKKAILICEEQHEACLYVRSTGHQFWWRKVSS